jgi:hypothetical protein
VCPCELKTGGPYTFINGVGLILILGGLCGVAHNFGYIKDEDMTEI